MPKGGSLQDGLMRSIFGGENPRELRLVVETPRPVEEQTDPQTPNGPARYAQMIILVEIGSA